MTAAYGPTHVLPALYRVCFTDRDDLDMRSIKTMLIIATLHSKMRTIYFRPMVSIFFLRLAANAGPKKVTKNRHLDTIA